jgi:hypothetical protein
MKKNIIVILFIPTLFYLSCITSCQYDEVVPELIISGEEVSFSNDLIPIFDASCNNASCHNTGGIPPNLIAANAYDAIINGDYINTAAPESSEFYQWVNGGRSLTMPLSGTDPQIASAVLLWIQQGAPNN